jgi:hypothetical protein
MQNIKKLKPVIVWWEDITGHTGWAAKTGEEHLEHDTLKCTAIGFLVKKTKKKLILAGTYALGEDPKERWCDVTVFPMGCVKKIIPIKL